jgi:hypothetical protein
MVLYLSSTNRQLFCVSIEFMCYLVNPIAMLFRFSSC